jgi:hypothetical protein
MKGTILTLGLFLFFFCATGAFAQQGTVLDSNVRPFEPPDHSQHATEHAMGAETSLLGSAALIYGKGEQPLSDFATPIYHRPLGDVARAYKKEHENAPKAVMTLNKQ